MTEPHGIDPEAIEQRAWELTRRLAVQNANETPTTWASVPEGQRQFAIEQALQQLLRERDGSPIDAVQVKMPEPEKVAAVIAKMNDHFSGIGTAVGGMIDAVSGLLVPLSALIDKLKQIEDDQGRGFWMTHGEVETDTWVTDVSRLRDEIDLLL